MATRAVDILIRAKDQTQAAFVSAGAGLKGLADTAFSLKGALVGALGGLGIAKVLKDSLTGYAEAEQAQSQLAEALKLTGRYSRAAMDDLNDFAGQVMAVTTMDDDAVTSLAAFGAALGKLSGDSLKQATIAAIGWSKVMRTDAQTAMQLLVRVVEGGNTAAFTRYGVVLDATMTKQQQIDAIVRRGIQSFSLARAETDTLAGSFERFRNDVGNLGESIGAELAPAVMSLLRSFHAALPTIGGGLAVFVEASKTFAQAVKETVSGVAGDMAALLATVGVAQKGWSDIWELMEVSIFNFADAVKFSFADVAQSVQSFMAFLDRRASGNLAVYMRYLDLRREKYGGVFASSFVPRHEKRALWEQAAKETREFLGGRDILQEVSDVPWNFANNIKTLEQYRKDLASKLFPGGKGDTPLRDWAAELRKTFDEVRATMTGDATGIDPVLESLAALQARWGGVANAANAAANASRRAWSAQERRLGGVAWGNQPSDPMGAWRSRQAEAREDRAARAREHAESVRVMQEILAEIRRGNTERNGQPAVELMESL